MNFNYQYSLIKGRCSKSRNTTDKHRKIHELDFDVDYLEEIWNEQKGKCPITGWNLILKTSADKKKKLLPKHASLDRLDNSKGYIKGNIRFISVMANFALNNKFTDEELVTFAFQITGMQD